MGFLSNLKQSWKKSGALRNLQARIAPPGQSTDDAVNRFLTSLGSGSDPRAEAMKAYLDLCVADAGVATVMRDYKVSKADLERIYSQLLVVGLGQGDKGHYVALSTIAYFEPLAFYVESERIGTDRLTVGSKLLDYWEGKVSHGALLGEIGKQ